MRLPPQLFPRRAGAPHQRSPGTAGIPGPSRDGADVPICVHRGGPSGGVRARHSVSIRARRRDPATSISRRSAGGARACARSRSRAPTLRGRLAITRISGDQGHVDWGLSPSFADTPSLRLCASGGGLHARSAAGAARTRPGGSARLISTSRGAFRVTGVRRAPASPEDASGTSSLSRTTKVPPTMTWAMPDDGRVEAPYVAWSVTRASSNATRSASVPGLDAALAAHCGHRVL